MHSFGDGYCLTFSDAPPLVSVSHHMKTFPPFLTSIHTSFRSSRLRMFTTAVPCITPTSKSSLVMSSFNYSLITFLRAGTDSTFPSSMLHNINVLTSFLLIFVQIHLGNYTLPGLNLRLTGQCSHNNCTGLGRFLPKWYRSGTRGCHNVPGNIMDGYRSEHHSWRCSSSSSSLIRTHFQAHLECHVPRFKGYTLRMRMTNLDNPLEILGMHNILRCGRCRRGDMQ